MTFKAFHSLWQSVFSKHGYNDIPFHPLFFWVTLPLPALPPEEPDRLLHSGICLAPKMSEREFRKVELCEFQGQGHGGLASSSSAGMQILQTQDAVQIISPCKATMLKASLAPCRGHWHKALESSQPRLQTSKRNSKLDFQSTFHVKVLENPC